MLHTVIRACARALTWVSLGLWPALALAQEETPKLENPLSPSGGFVDPNELFARIAKEFALAIGAAALFFVVLGGYIILTASGNAERYQKGKKTIAYAAIGMILVVGSYVLLSMAINVATGWQGLPPLEQFHLTDPLRVTGPFDFYGGRLAKFFVSGLGALTVLVVVWGGLQWVVAAGNEEKIKKARQTLSYAFVGAALVMSSYIIMSFVYRPLYNLFSSGQVDRSAVAPPRTPEPTATQPVACFRLEQDKTFGADCEVEPYNECVKPKSGKRRGEVVYLTNPTTNRRSIVNDCNDVGACVQQLPGTAYVNRVAAAACIENNAQSAKLFSPMNRGLSDGTCPFAGQIPIDDGASGRPYYQCYADVEFKSGQDWPRTDEWACTRERLRVANVCSGGIRPGTPCTYDGQCGSGGRCVPRSSRTYVYDYCRTETARTCGEELNTGVGPRYFPGAFYNYRTCDEIGYCELDWSGHYACKDGVVEQQCTRLLFPSVGVPVPPWGCGYYDEVAGACYVPQSGITFHSAGNSNLGPNGYHCPTR